MPDQLFDSLTEDMTVRPLPPSEVRRRGDRRRRLQQAGAALAGVAAIAAVVLPITLSHGGSDRSLPPVATSPTDTATGVVTMVPADFPLTAGMPRPSTLETLPLTTDEETACGTVAWGATRPVPSIDGATVGYHDASEGGETRSIALYAGEEQARAAQRAIETALSSCGTVDDGSGKVTELQRATAAVPTDVWVIKWTDEQGDLTGEGMLSTATQVGNAMLLQSATFMSAGDDAVVQHEASRLADRSATVVDAMCMFSDQPCVTARSTAPPAPASDVLGPTGYGALRIGMTYDQALASGEIGAASADGGGLQIAAHPDAGLCLSRKDGLMAIFLGSGMHTAEGIAIGSPVADLIATYPDLKPYDPDSKVGGPGIFRADAADGAWYEIDVERNLKVSTVILRQDHQTCFE